MAAAAEASDTMSLTDPVILITGATGYVGHHLLSSILESFPSSIVHATHRSQNPTITSDRVRYHQIEFADDDSVRSSVISIFDSGFIPEIIIHCAAMTKPGHCQQNEAASMRINCPRYFIQCLLSHYKRIESKERNPSTETMQSEFNDKVSIGIISSADLNHLSDCNLRSQLMMKPLFIFFSTDHVYDGELADPNSVEHAPRFSVDDHGSKQNQTKSKILMSRIGRRHSAPTNNESVMTSSHDSSAKRKERGIYTEQSPCYPLNYYGQSKLEMEEYLMMHWENVVVLRSSIIYGPSIGKRGTLLQFIVNQLGADSKDKVTLFRNETRNFVSIESVVKVVGHFIVEYQSYHRDYHDIFNCGGIQRLNRVQFGQIVGRVYGLDTAKIEGISRFECAEEWAHQAPNPQDVSMSSNKLYVEMEEYYVFPTVEDSIKRIKSESQSNQ